MKDCIQKEKLNRVLFRLVLVERYHVMIQIKKKKQEADEKNRNNKK